MGRFRLVTMVTNTGRYVTSHLVLILTVSKLPMGVGFLFILTEFFLPSARAESVKNAAEAVKRALDDAKRAQSAAEKAINSADSDIQHTNTVVNEVRHHNELFFLPAQRK